MNINIYLSTIGINTFTNNYKYIIYINCFLFIISYIPLYYGIYNIFVLKTTDQILQCMIMMNDMALYYSLQRKNCIKYINSFINDDINPIKREKIIFPLLSATVFISILLSIIFVTFGFYNINIPLVNQLTDNIILKSFFTFFYTYYSLQIQLYGLIIFFSVFFVLSNYLEDYKELLKNNNYSIPDICQQFLEIRHKYGKAVKYLNCVLSSNITFNFIPFCMCLIKLFDSKLIDVLNIKSSIYFILSIYIFHILLSNINGSIDGIRNTIDNNRYLRQFLDRKTENYSLNINLQDLNTINNNQINFKNYLLEIENGESLDWLIINNITSQQWKSFEILGYDWNNNNIIAKLASLIVILLFGKSII